MYDMAQAFLLTEVDEEIGNRLDEYVNTLVSDHSEYVFVDGEEGDYGKVKYMDPTDNQLICTRVIESGDVEDFQFTRAGKSRFLTIVFGVTQELCIQNALGSK